MPGPRVTLISASGKRRVGWYVAEAIGGLPGGDRLP